MVSNVRPRVQILVLDLRPLFLFLNSVAYAQAVQLHTGLNWRTDPDFANSRILKAVFAVLQTGDAGEVEIYHHTKRIEMDRARLLANYWQTAIHKLPYGPKFLLTYLEQLDSIKQYSIEATRGVFRDAAKINADIKDAWEESITALARIRLGSTVVILPAATIVGIGAAGIGAAGLALDMAVISTGYQWIGSFARSLGEGKNAQVIVFKTGKSIGESAADKLVDHSMDIATESANRELEKNSEIIEKAKKEIEVLSRQLQRKVSTYKIAKKLREIEKTNSKLASAASAGKTFARIAKYAKPAARVFSIAFLANDLYEAVKEYNEETEH